MPYIEKSTQFGSGKYITLGDTLGWIEYDTPFSLSIWFKTTSTVTTAEMLMSKQAGSPNYEGWAAYIDTGQLYFYLANAWTSAYTSVRTSDTFNDGEWHHAVFTYNAETPGAAADIIITVDGVARALVTIASTLGSNSIATTASFNISGRTDGTKTWPDRLCLAVLYDKALSVSEAQELYNGGTPINPKLLASSKDAIVEVWPLGMGDTYPTALGVNQAPVVPWTAGIVSPYRQVPNETVPAEWLRGVSTRDMEPFYPGPGGSEGRFSMRSPGTALCRAGPINRMEFDDPWSMVIWLNWTFNKTYGVIMGRAQDGNGSGGYVLRTSYNNSGALDVFMRASNQILVNTVASSFNDGSWHLVVATYDGSVNYNGIHIWVDAVDQALNLWNNYLYGTWTDKSFCVGGSGDSPNSYSYDGLLLQPAVYDRVLTGAEVAAIYNGGTPVDLSGLSSASALLSYWPIGATSAEGTGEDKVDGTMLNMDSSDVTTGPGGVLARALSFNGTDQSINYGDRFNFQYDQPFTHVIWFKTSYSGGDNWIFAKMDSSLRGYGAYLTSTGVLTYNIQSTGSALISVASTTSGLNDGNWHQAILTYDGSGLASGVTMYVAGTAETPVVGSDTLASGTIVDTGPLRLGQKGDQSSWFSGDLAGFHVYATDLQAADATALWNSGTPVDPTGIASADYLVGYWQVGDGMYPGTMVGMSGADIVDDAPYVSTLSTEKTWTTYANYTTNVAGSTVGGRPILLDWKNKLAANGWTVIGSSNSVTYEWKGTTAGGSYGGDSTGPYDVWAAESDIVFRDSDSGLGPMSWVVLRSPLTLAGQFWLTIAYYGSDYERCLSFITPIKPTLPGSPTDDYPGPSNDYRLWIDENGRFWDYYNTSVSVRHYFSVATDGSFIKASGNDNESDWNCVTMFIVTDPSDALFPAKSQVKMNAVSWFWFFSGPDYWEFYSRFRICTQLSPDSVRASAVYPGWGGSLNNSLDWSDDWVGGAQAYPIILCPHFGNVASESYGSAFPLLRVPDVFLCSVTLGRGSMAPYASPYKYTCMEGAFWIPGDTEPDFS